MGISAREPAWQWELTCTGVNETATERDEVGDPPQTVQNATMDHLLKTKR